MNNIKTTLVIVLSIALTAFVLVAIWSGVQPSNAGYNTKTAGVVTAEPANNDVVDMTEVDDESATMEESAAVTTETETVASATEETTDSAPTMPADVETATTEVINAVSEQAQVAETQVEAAATAVEETAAATVAAAGGGQIHVVTTEGLKYAPLVVKIAVGDTVAWENMNTHDTQSLEGLIPEGAEMWHSKMSENFQRTFTVEGIYVYKCTPHFGAGMGGAIIVGNPVNLEAIKAAPATGAAKRLVKKAIQAAEAS